MNKSDEIEFAKEILLVCNYKMFIKIVQTCKASKKWQKNKKKCTDLVLFVSRHLPPWGRVVRAGDPIICQLLPEVEIFLGLIVGQ